MSRVGSAHGKNEQIIDFGGLLGGLNKSIDGTDIEVNELLDALNMKYDRASGKLTTRNGLTIATDSPIDPIVALYIGVAAGTKRLLAASDTAKLYDIANLPEQETMLSSFELAFIPFEIWMIQDADTNSYWDDTYYTNPYEGVVCGQIYHDGASVSDLLFVPLDGCSDEPRMVADSSGGWDYMKVGYNPDIGPGHNDWARRLRNESGAFYNFSVISTKLQKGPAWTTANILVKVYDATFTTILAQGTLLDADIPPNGVPAFVDIQLDATVGLANLDYCFITLECATQKTSMSDWVQLETTYRTPDYSRRPWGGSWIATDSGYGPIMVLKNSVGETVKQDYYTGYQLSLNFRIAVRVNDISGWALSGNTYLRFKTDDSNYADYYFKVADISATWVVIDIYRGNRYGVNGDWDLIVGTPDFSNITEIRLVSENTTGVREMYIDKLHVYEAARSGAIELGNLSGNLVPTFDNFLESGGNEAIFIASGGVLQYWDGGVALSNVTGAPNCSMVAVKSGRVFVNDLNQRDIVRGSGILDATYDADSWRYPLSVFAQAGWPDGDDIVAMHVIGDDLIMFKGAVHKKIVRLVGAYPEWKLVEVARGTSTMNSQSVTSVGASTFILDVDGINTLKGVDVYGEMQVSPISDVLGDELTSRVDDTGFVLKWPVNACIIVKPSTSDGRMFLMHYDISQKGELELKWTPWEFEIPNVSCGVYDYETDTIYFGSLNGNVYILDNAVYQDNLTDYDQLVKGKILREDGYQLLLKEVVLDYDEVSAGTLELLVYKDRGTTEIVLDTVTISSVSDQVLRSKIRTRSRDLQVGLRVTGGGSIVVNALMARVAIVGRD